MCHFLKCKEGWLELVFGGNFCQLHKFLPTTVFPKVQVRSSSLDTKSALEKMSHVKLTSSQILCLYIYYKGLYTLLKKKRILTLMFVTFELQLQFWSLEWNLHDLQLLMDEIIESPNQRQCCTCIRSATRGPRTLIYLKWMCMCLGTSRYSLQEFYKFHEFDIPWNHEKKQSMASVIHGKHIPNHTRLQWALHGPLNLRREQHITMRLDCVIKYSSNSRFIWYHNRSVKEYPLWPFASQFHFYSLIQESYKVRTQVASEF